MDQEYVQGLRDAKALLDEGIFTQEEFMREKETLFKQREERVAERARLGVTAMPVVSGFKRKSEDGRGDKEPKSPPSSKWAKYRKKCVHGKDVYECRACGGKRMCEHDKRRTRCPICSGLGVPNVCLPVEQVPSPSEGAPLNRSALHPPPPPPPEFAERKIPAFQPISQGNMAAASQQFQQVKHDNISAASQQDAGVRQAVQ